MGTFDVHGLKLIVVMHRPSDVVGGVKQGVILGLGSHEPLNFMLRAGEVRSFQGEMNGLWKQLVLVLVTLLESLMWLK